MKIPAPKLLLCIYLADGKLKVRKQLHAQTQHTGTFCVKLVFEIGRKKICLKTLLQMMFKSAFVSLLSVHSQVQKIDYTRVWC